MCKDNIKDEGRMPDSIEKMTRPVYPEQSRYPDPRIHCDPNVIPKGQLTCVCGNKKYQQVGVSDGFIEG